MGFGSEAAIAATGVTSSAGAITAYNYAEATVHDLTLVTFPTQGPTDLSCLCTLPGIRPFRIGDFIVHARPIGASNVTQIRQHGGKKKGRPVFTSVLACGAGVKPLLEQAEPLMHLGHPELQRAAHKRSSLGLNRDGIRYSITCEFTDYGSAPVVLHPHAKTCAFEFPQDENDLHARGVLTRRQIFRLNGAIPLRPVTIIQVSVVNYGSMVEVVVTSWHYYRHDREELCQCVKVVETISLYPGELNLAA